MFIVFHIVSSIFYSSMNHLQDTHFPKKILSGENHLDKTLLFNRNTRFIKKKHKIHKLYGFPLNFIKGDQNAKAKPTQTWNTSSPPPTVN